LIIIILNQKHVDLGRLLMIEYYSFISDIKLRKNLTYEFWHNMPAGKTASHPLLPVEETIRARVLMNCEFRYHTFYSGFSPWPLIPPTDVRRLRWGRKGDGKLYYISAGRENTYCPNRTNWGTVLTHATGNYPFNVDWYMRECNTVANVKKYVGEFH